MAQTGYTPIQLYSTPTPGASPAASNLTSGELAINAADGKLFYKDTAGNTQVIANSAYSSGVAIQGSGTSVVGTGTVQFANSNGVTFGLNGSTITASAVSGPSIQGSGTDVVSAGTVQFANSNGVTFGLNGSTMTASVAVSAPNVTFSAGTASIATGSVVFASSNGISFGLTSNTITAGSVLSSYAPVGQYSGYNRNAVAGGFSVVPVAPITLTQSLAFQYAKQVIVLATGSRNITMRYAVTDSTSDFGFTQSTLFVHNISSKNVDTLSSQVSMSMPVSFVGAASMSSATAANTNSYLRTVTQSMSVIYATNTATNGYQFATVSSTFTSATTANSTIITGGTFTFPINATAMSFASGVTGQKMYSMANSAPITLAPNTYWAGVGATISSTNAPGVTVGIGGGGTIPGVFMFAPRFDLYIMTGGTSTGEGLAYAEAIPNIAMNSSAPALSDYGVVYVRTNGASYTQLYNGSVFSFPNAASYASTAFSTSGTYSVAGAPDTWAVPNVYVPRVTYQ